ncbi:MAG: hypothetical protein QOH61_13 [Chloroflexota bacterium]|jgi:hypothetical protein|nr:hypothetical protein [Chloroflexota bacterium]
MTARSGRVRAARITDLAALGELSRLSHSPEGEDDGDARPVRSLGLPITASQVSVFSLFRMPLGAFQPHDPLYVYEDDGHLAGLARVERDGHRDEWTIVELDAVDHGEAGDIRFRLVQQILRDAGKRAVERIHVACSDEGGNVELFMQAGFARYGEEVILHRGSGQQWPALPSDADAARMRIRPTTGLDALKLHRLYQSATPRPVFRFEGYRIPDWERQGNQWRIPRSSLTPILRFADVEAFVQECPPGTPELAAFIQIGVAKSDQPHYLRVVATPETDPSELIAYGLSVIGRRSSDARSVLTAVRTYESPLDRRLEEAGFEPISNVSLLLKENLVRVAEPMLVPAVR